MVAGAFWKTRMEEMAEVIVAQTTRHHGKEILPGRSVARPLPAGASLMPEPALGGVAPIFSGPLFALLLWWLALALGHRLLRLFGAPLALLTVWEKGLVSLCFGAGTLQFLPWALALFGKMNRSFLLPAVLVLALLLLPDLARVAKKAIAAIRDLAAAGLSGPRAVWASLLATLLMLSLLRAVRIDSFVDDDGYHLTAPQRWLRTGRLDYLPSYTHSNGCSGFEMLYALALALWDPVAAKVLHWSAGIFSLMAVFLCALRLKRPLAGYLAISCLVVASPFWSLPYLMGTAMVDFGATWMAMTAALLWLIWLRESATSLLAMMALCVGFAGSFKFTAIVLVGAWLPVLVFDARQARLGWSPTVARVLRFGATASLPILPWLHRNWANTGNPVYPMFSRLLPTRDWNPHHAEVFSRYIKYYAWGVASGSRLGELQRKELVLVTALLVVTVTAIAWLRLKSHALRDLLMVGAIFALVELLSAGLVFRYWLPGAISLVLLASALAADRLVDSRWRHWPACAIVALALGIQLHTVKTRRADLRVATGLTTLAEEYAADPAWRTWGFINANTPADAHILSVALYDSFGISSFASLWAPRTFFTTDSHLQTRIELQDWPSFVRSLQRDHIQYFLITDKQYNPNRQGFDDVELRNEYPFGRRMADRYGDLLVQFGPLQFYRVHPDRASSAIERGAHE
jgi:hypothetical protein